ncbi:MAG: VWA domain-containing protein [Gemmatimonadetes bacterium]|nr:VWA domain-containing protein [Gemmatimonadota bacterium]
MTSVEFVRPELLQLLLLVPAWLLLVWPLSGGGVFHPRGEAHGPPESGGLQVGLVLWLPRVLRVTALASLVVALAHPQRVLFEEESSLRGKGLAIAVDISTSMLADDMDNDDSRMSVARRAATRFAEGRRLDELSLVAFAGQAVQRVPNTTDPGLIVSGVTSLQPQLVLDGTDIAAAVVTSLASLLESEREERVIVLLTDGAHNGQGVTPLRAARGAAALGVRVHSIALVGEPDFEGMSPALRAANLRRLSEVEAQMEGVLSAISEVTGGQYFRASGEAALDSIYRTISELEAPVEVTTQVPVRTSLQVWLLLFALIAIGLEALLRGSRWSLVP